MTLQIKIISYNLIILGVGFLLLLLFYASEHAINLTSIFNIVIAVIGGIGLLSKQTYGWVLSLITSINLVCLGIYSIINSFNQPDEFPNSSVTDTGIIFGIIFLTIYGILFYAIFHLNHKSVTNRYCVSNNLQIISIVIGGLYAGWHILRM